jgi:hypothetical protein
MQGLVHAKPRPSWSHLLISQFGKFPRIGTTSKLKCESGMEEEEKVWKNHFSGTPKNFHGFNVLCQKVDKSLRFSIEKWKRKKKPTFEIEFICTVSNA